MTRMWSITVRHTMIQQTEFICPRCGIDRIGTEVEVQRWFAIGRFPVIPLAALPSEVICETCGHHSDSGVLEIPTTGQLVELLGLAIRSSISFVLRSGRANAFDFRIDTAASEAALSLMNADGHHYDEADLAHVMAQLGDDDARVNLGQLSSELTPYGKQGFLHRMAAVALADGPMSDRETRALAEIGVFLGMSAPHINGVLAVAALQPEAA